MTVAQAAKQLGISESKLYQLVAARAIAYFRVGGKILFSDAHVQAYLESCHVGAVTSTMTAPRVQLKLKHLSLRH